MKTAWEAERRQNQHWKKNLRYETTQEEVEKYKAMKEIN